MTRAKNGCEISPSHPARIIHRMNCAKCIKIRTTAIRMYDTKIRTDGSFDPFAGDGERIVVVTTLLIAHTLATSHTGYARKSWMQSGSNRRLHIKEGKREKICSIRLDSYKYSNSWIYIVSALEIIFLWYLISRNTYFYFYWFLNSRFFFFLNHLQYFYLIFLRIYESMHILAFFVTWFEGCARSSFCQWYLFFFSCH